VTALIAQIFWHIRNIELSKSVYENSLSNMERALKSSKSPGHIQTAIFESPSLPWIESTHEVFQSWYLLENLAALDNLLKLFDQAMQTDDNPKLDQSHEQIMSNSDNEAGGLYRHQSGNLDISAAINIYWISKDRSVDHGEFLARLNSAADANEISIWSRILGLSPATPFCLLSNRELEFPQELAVIENPINVLWPE
jgi:hypothetical protein